MIGRGEIRCASLGEPAGSAPGERRPVLIVSTDTCNLSAIGTVIVVAITGNLVFAEAPGNVALPSETTGLPKDSVANVSAVVTLDKRTLGEPVATLDAATMSLVDDGLRRALQLA
ncbi:type II toxin-antitoxin system PemK/MazF family toxin [Ilumatobacter sp.]|uniref:type II toxin-antitoxin system PemK/MazF family toxin n=1 Tax=Ilumatobacter sp. TaxID=1967498 RepID=UPI003C587BB3